MPALLELPFQDAQRMFNSFYYQQGAKYAPDFTTSTSSGTKLSCAEADAFHSFLKKRFKGSLPREIRVLELGCGNGDSAFRFLQRLKQLDAKSGTGYSGRLGYTLADFSAPMIRDAFFNEELKEFGSQLDFALVDAESPKFDDGNFLLVRGNGLFDSLPTQLVASHGGSFNELWLEMSLDEDYDIFTLAGDPIARSEFAWMVSSHLPSLLAQVDGSFVSKLELEVRRRPVKMDSASHMLMHSAFGKIPEGMVIPLPFAASSCLASLRKYLASGAVVDTFDCGFNSLAELQGLQSGIFRTPGALTSFVNFPFLSGIAPMLGYANASVEPQHRFTGGKPEKNLYHLQLTSKSR